MSDIKTLNGHNLVDTAATAKLNSVIESVGGDTLTWDGSYDESLLIGGVLYKISDATPSNDEFSSGTVRINGTEYAMTVEAADESGNITGVIAAGIMFIAVIRSENADLDGVVIEEPGIYAVQLLGQGFSLTIPGYTGFATEKIKQDALPEGVKVNPTWDDIGSKYGVICEGENLEVPADGATLNANGLPSPGDSVTVVFDGTTYTCVVDEIFGAYAYVGNSNLMEIASDSEEPFLILFISKTEAVMIVQDVTQLHSVKVSGIIKTKIPDVYISGIKKLYMGQQDANALYLFHETFEATKITQAELVEIANKKPIVLTLGDMCLFNPLIIAPYAGTNDAGEAYGAVFVQRNASSSFNMQAYYTAEYTPT